MFLEDGRRLKVARYEVTDRSPVVTFDGLTDRAGAEALRGAALYIESQWRRPLGEDEFWPDELVGLAVFDVEGEPVGHVAEVEVGLSQDRLIVGTAEGKIIVPLVEALVPVVSVGEGRVVVDLPPGFTDPELTERA